MLSLRLSGLDTKSYFPRGTEETRDDLGLSGLYLICKVAAVAGFCSIQKM